jgi:hypothetical protein
MAVEAVAEKMRKGGNFASSDQDDLVRVVGLEPTHREVRVFETLASTIPPHPHGPFSHMR